MMRGSDRSKWGTGSRRRRYPVRRVAVGPALSGRPRDLASGRESCRSAVCDPARRSASHFERPRSSFPSGATRGQRSPPRRVGSGAVVEVGTFARFSRKIDRSPSSCARSRIWLRVPYRGRRPPLRPTTAATPPTPTRRPPATSRPTPVLRLRFCGDQRSSNSASAPGPGPRRSRGCRSASGRDLAPARRRCRARPRASSRTLRTRRPRATRERADDERSS